MRQILPALTLTILHLANPLAASNDSEALTQALFELLEGKSSKEASETLESAGFQCFGSLCVKFEHIGFTNKQKQRRMTRTTTRVTLPKGEIRRQSDLSVNHQVTTLTPSTRTQDAD